LDVLGKRDDGYHEVETLMVPVRLWDSLSFAATPPSSDDRRAIRLTIFQSSCTPSASVPVNQENLVVRALALLRDRSGCRLGADVELVKRIPMAAGLGGGSSDAAAALWLANWGWRLGWSRERLTAVAAEIGSDVPFFLNDQAAICRGRGERVETIHDVIPLHFVMVKPPAELRTADVYRTLGATVLDGPVSPSPRVNSLIAALQRGRLLEIGRLMRNGLQTAAAELSPWIERVRSAFHELDCVAHQLSGSGAAYFGLCRHAEHARRMASVLRTRALGTVYALRSYP
jgi:4-diphosphocytidyl-2-C-methyl-D-erythritol kinase